MSPMPLTGRSSGVRSGGNSRPCSLRVEPQPQKVGVRRIVGAGRCALQTFVNEARADGDRAGELVLEARPGRHGLLRELYAFVVGLADADQAGEAEVAPQIVLGLESRPLGARAARVRDGG